MKKNRIMALLLTGLMTASMLAGADGSFASAAPEAESEEQTASQTTMPDILMIAKQGMFSSGGTVTAPVEGTYDATTNWLDATRTGNTAHVDCHKHGGSRIFCEDDRFTGQSLSSY